MTLESLVIDPMAISQGVHGVGVESTFNIVRVRVLVLYMVEDCRCCRRVQGNVLEGFKEDREKCGNEDCVVGVF